MLLYLILSGQNSSFANLKLLALLWFDVAFIYDLCWVFFYCFNFDYGDPSESKTLWLFLLLKSYVVSHNLFCVVWKDPCYDFLNELSII